MTMYEHYIKLFESHLNQHAIVRFGSGDFNANGTVAKVFAEYVVLGKEPDARYVFYRNMADVIFMQQ
jgi:hypothetical protein